VLTRCGLPLPVYFLADEKHTSCLTTKAYLPTMVSGRVLWHLGYTEEASAAAFTESYQEFQRAALAQEPTYRVRGILTDGFDSTTKSLRTLFPGARHGFCLRHAINKLPGKLVAIASPVRKALRSQFHTVLYRARQRKGLRVFALGQRLRHFVDHVTHTAGAANGERVRRWVQDKKQHLENVRRKGLFPRLRNNRANLLLGRLFRLKLRGFCSSCRAPRWESHGHSSRPWIV
jgi:hypothetical protein